MKKLMTMLAAGALAATGALSACETAPKTEPERQALVTAANAKITEFRTADPSMSQFFDTSAGYAVFPTVGSGAFIVGGSYGRGVVYERGIAVGFADITAGSIGLSAGGQGFSEVVFFQTQEVLDKFKAGKFSFTADANAVAVDAGAAATARFRNGVAVFIRGQSGLMADASIGGQGFGYKPF